MLAGIRNRGYSVKFTSEPRLKAVKFTGEQASRSGRLLFASLFRACSGQFLGLLEPVT
jgi:hypothetical protein